MRAYVAPWELPKSVRTIDRTEVSYLTDGTCQHVETMCCDCRDSWEMDHEVTLEL